MKFSIKRWMFLFLMLSTFSFADTYVKIAKPPQTQPQKTTPQPKNKDASFNSMRSVPTINAQGVKPILRSLPLDANINDQIKAIQNANPNQALLIDAKTKKVVGVLPLSQQKDSPTKLSRFQAHKKQSRVQPVSPKVSITPYEMQEETIILQ